MLCLAILGLAACSLPTRQVDATSTQANPTTVTSPTPTTDWFPVTFTPTTFTTAVPVTPTPLPTPPVSYGKLIYQDDFTQPGGWTTGQFTAGAIAYGNGQLGLAITQPHGVLSSKRAEPVLSNFYLEITATPSLCLNADNYGIQFRMSSANDFYRFTITCAGQLRLERLKAGAGQVLHDWSASAQALPTISGDYRLAVWANGDELSLYIGGVLQFTLHDGSLSTGGLGLFARSMGDTPVTITFSKLAVYETTPSLLPTATPTPG